MFANSRQSPSQQQIRSQRLQGFSWKVSLWKLNTSCPCPCLSWLGWSTKSIKNHQVTVGFTNQVNLDRHCSGPSVLAPVRLFSLNVPESSKLRVWSMTCIMFNLPERCIENRFCNWLSYSIIPSCVSTSVWARILVIVTSVTPSINDLHCFCDTIQLDQQQIWWESTLLLFCQIKAIVFFWNTRWQLHQCFYCQVVIIQVQKNDDDNKNLCRTCAFCQWHIMCVCIAVYCTFSLMALFTRQQWLDEDKGSWRWAATWQYPLYPGLMFSQYDSPISMSAPCRVCRLPSVLLWLTAVSLWTLTQPGHRHQAQLHPGTVQQGVVVLIVV